ncbi:UNVERIFIED_CONTAM: hypothetical protein FKN15_043015 [Acipenser sinensis]
MRTHPRGRRPSNQNRIEKRSLTEGSDADTSQGQRNQRPKTHTRVMTRRAAPREEVGSEGWDTRGDERERELGHVVWRGVETGRIVHSYHDNTDQLAHQLPQYVNRTGLFDSELQRGNASLLLRRVREEDAGNYSCSVYPHKWHGMGLIELVPVPAQPTSAAITAEPTSAAAAVLNVRRPWWVSGAVLVYWVVASFCIGLKLYIQHAGCCFWKSHNALKAQYSAGQDSETQ